jgi:hypothetical protein
VKRTIIIAASLLATVSIAGPASAANENSGDHARDQAAKRCAAEKKADKQAFRATYGKHAMRNCIKSEPEAGDVAEFKNAAKECRAEREADAEGFQGTYGTNDNRRNAFGKCVSGKMHEDEEPTPTS